MKDKVVVQNVTLYQRDIDKLTELAEALYPLKSERRLSEVVRRLIRAAKVVDGKLEGEHE